VIGGKEPAHLVFEGIAFETPGQSAVYVESSHVTLRRCWFAGSIGAVREGSDVTIEYCEFHQYPAYDDATELLREAGVSSQSQKKDYSLIWHRKHRDHGCRTQDYEDGGLALRMRNNWRIRHNYIHDCYDGLAGSGMSGSVRAHIHDNVFARCCDNALETESHARDAHIYRNLFVDSLDAISYQPLAGPPWPGPIYFHENIVASTPEHAARWPYSNPTGASAFKIGISLKNWSGGKHADVPRSPLAAPEPGLFFVNNTIYLPHSKVFNPLGSSDVPIAGVFWINNLFVTDHLASMTKSDAMRPGHFEFRNNLVAPARPGSIGPGAIAAGQGGRALADAQAIGLRNPEELDFSLVPQSPARGRSIAVLGTSGAKLDDIGAIQENSEWYPPRVGPTAEPFRLR
jgi:hypothetical protein